MKKIVKNIYRRICQKIEQITRKALRLPQNTGLPYNISYRLGNLVKLVQPYAMAHSSVLSMLHGLARESVAKVEGDIVECGVRNGGSAAIMADTIQNLSGRKIWLYDTFAGIPAPGEKDTPFARQYEGKWKGSIKNVKKILEKVGLQPEKAVFQKGIFQDTFKKRLPDKVAILHIDADWYESVSLALKTFYPLVPEGGVIILDDFGHWDGTKKAFFDFCAEEKIYPLVERLGHSQLFWHKGKDNNRQTWNKYFLGIYYPKYQ